jgi:hypothetical protein
MTRRHNKIVHRGRESASLGVSLGPFQLAAWVSTRRVTDEARGPVGTPSDVPRP